MRLFQSHRLEQIFWVQDLHFWIAQVGFPVLIRYTGILDCKPLINTYCKIGSR